MKLSTNTRHYRNYQQWYKGSRSSLKYDLLEGKRQLDLCTYMRIQVLRVPFTKLGIFGSNHPGVATIIFSLIAYFAMAAAMSADPDYSFAYALLMAAVIIGIVFTTLAFVAGTVLGIEYLRERRGDGILPEYIKARKSKVCPLIEFEEEQ